MNFEIGQIAFALRSKAYIGLGYSSGVRVDIWEFKPFDAADMAD